MLLSLTAKTGRIIMHMEVLHGILSSVSLTILCTEAVKEWSGLSMAFYFPIHRVAIGTFISVSTRKNYAADQDPETVDFKCVIYKSSDRGKTWDRSGDLFPPNLVCYDSIKIQAPDVMVYLF